MSSNLVVPFNFQPSSVSIKTSSYTIPAGKYAKVNISLLGISYFTINGGVAIECTAHTVLATDNLRVTTMAGGATGNHLSVAQMDSSGQTLIAPGSAFNENTVNQLIQAEYWLPSGTVIAGSGTWKAVVQEFINIT